MLKRERAIKQDGCGGFDACGGLCICICVCICVFVYFYLVDGMMPAAGSQLS